MKLPRSGYRDLGFLGSSNFDPVFMGRTIIEDPEISMKRDMKRTVSTLIKANCECYIEPKEEEEQG